MCIRIKRTYNGGAWHQTVAVNDKLTRKRLHKPERPALAAVETSAGRKAAMGANIATVPACAPSAYGKI